MINAVFIMNNQGKPRLCKFYEYLVRPDWFVSVLLRVTMACNVGRQAAAELSTCCLQVDIQA